MTQEEADKSLGKIVREAMTKAMPLDYSTAIQMYVTVDLEGFGVVLVKIEVLGSQRPTKH